MSTATIQSKTWRRVKLGDFLKIRRGASPRPIHEYIREAGMPWLKIADVTSSDSRFVSSTKEFIKEEGISKSVIVRPGDLILSNSATPGIPRFMRITACVHDGWLILEPINESINKEFLYYRLIVDRSKLISNVTGAIFDNLKTDVLRDHEILLPPVNEQQCIADILSAFDDKIDLNNKISRTLEEMAQAIFKEWFVDSGLSRGQRDGTVKEFGRVVTGKTPPTKDAENFGSQYPFITIPDMREMFVISTERHLSQKAANTMKNLVLPAGSICVSCIATVGLVCITTIESITNQQVNSIIPSKDIYRYFLYFFFKLRRRDLEAYGAGGTATAIINKTQFENISIVIPDDGLLEKFHLTVKSLFDKYLLTLRENQKLAALRDLLLPKLMSGELLVNK